MKRMSVLVSIAAVALFVVGTAPVHADESDELTFFTFSTPVALPGVVLPTGTYMFRRPLTYNANLIQVLSEDGRTVYGTFSTIPDVRSSDAGKAPVTFEETSAGSPEALKAWFYQGRSTGHEFIYRK
jgi:hypothetical protein